MNDPEDYASRSQAGLALSRFIDLNRDQDMLTQVLFPAIKAAMTSKNFDVRQEVPQSVRQDCSTVP